MNKVFMTGRAELGSESFDFQMGPWANGIGLMMRQAGYGKPVETGAGIWPSIAKAQEIAEKTVKQLLARDVSIVWSESIKRDASKDDR
jgi:hypothetical protein